MADLSAQRMAESELKSRIIWEPWHDLPELTLKRWPELREWNRIMRLRDEANRAKIDEELNRLQKPM